MAQMAMNRKGSMKSEKETEWDKMRQAKKDTETWRRTKSSGGLLPTGPKTSKQGRTDELLGHSDWETTDMFLPGSPALRVARWVNFVVKPVASRILVSNKILKIVTFRVCGNFGSRLVDSLRIILFHVVERPKSI